MKAAGSPGVVRCHGPGGIKTGGGRRAGKGGGEAPKCHEEPQQQPLCKGKEKAPKKEEQGLQQLHIPWLGQGYCQGCPCKGQAAKAADEYTPASSPLEKGKKERQRSQSVASTASLQWRKKQFPLTKKRKKETSGWMKKKKNTPPGDEGHPW